MNKRDNWKIQKVFYSSRPIHGVKTNEFRCELFFHVMYLSRYTAYRASLVESTRKGDHWSGEGGADFQRWMTVVINLLILLGHPYIIIM